MQSSGMALTRALVTSKVAKALMVNHSKAALVRHFHQSLVRLVPKSFVPIDTLYSKGFRQGHGSEETRPWNYLWQPGPYPETEEQRIAAAKKYVSGTSVVDPNVMFHVGLIDRECCQRITSRTIPKRPIILWVIIPS